MDSSAVVSLRGGRAPGVLDAVAGERENCLKEIANNYVEEEEEEEEEEEDDDVENNSSSEEEEEDDNNNNNNNNNRGDLRENGMQHDRRLGIGGEMHNEMQNGRFDGGALGVGGSVQSSGEEEEEEEEIEEEEVEEEEQEEEGGQEQEQEQEHEQEDDEGSVHSRRDTDMEENGFVNTNNNSREEGSVESGEHENKDDPAMGEEEEEGRAANEKAESADECTVVTTNALAGGQHDEFEEVPEEKSLTESEGAPPLQVVENGGGGGGVGVLLLAGPALRRRRGRPLKSNGRKTSSIRAAPITPKLEEPRAVRSNRGIKRRFPGDESEDSLPKRVRVRSIASVCGDFVQPIKGEDLSMEEGLETTPARRRGRPRKSERIQGLKDEDPDTPTGPSVGKRKMVEAVLESDSMKHPCHGRTGPIFACNAEGCKKQFVEAAQLYTHARVHGDRPYVCHYDGCIKSFSERSKLKRHFLIHTGEKPFLCHYEGCGKAFSLDFNLRSHMKTHTGDYHECPYDGCEKRYCQEYKLRAHIGKEHNKPVRGTKKMAKIGGNDVRGAIEAAAAAAQDSQKEAAKRKRERLAALQTKRSTLETMKEGKVSRLSELEQEKQREASELAHIEHNLKKLEREQRQLEDGGDVSSPVISLSLSEDDEESEEEEEEESEENDDDNEGGEDMAPSHGTTAAAAGDTSSSGEQQSRLLSSPLEYTAMGEGRDVVMFAHKLPTADQGAWLMKNMETRPIVDSSPPPPHHQEPTTSLTPLLWLQGVPPHSGHLAEIPALRPFLRSRRPGPPPPPVVVSDTVKQTKSSPVANNNNTSSLGAKEKNNSQPKRSNGELWSQGESSDSGLGKSKGGVGKANKQQQQQQQEGGGSGKPKGGNNNNPGKNLVGAAGGRGSGRHSNASNVVREKSLSNTNTDGELNGKLDHHRPQKQRERELPSTAKVSKPQQQSGRQFSSSSDQVFVSMNPILLSTDHGFSPTDARFLAANEGFSSFSAQGLLRDRLQLKEGVKTASCGGAHQPPFAPKEKAYRSMNEVLHSTAEQGLSACSALNDTGFVVAEQAPSEQSFEPSAAQLFTYHEQPRLVD